MNVLSKARKRQGLTQLQIAQRLGLGMRTISAYEQELRFIKVTDLLKVASVYGLSDEEVLLYLKEVARG